MIRRAALLLFGLTACGDAPSTPAMGGTTGGIATSSGSPTSSGPVPTSTTTGSEASGSPETDDSASTTGAGSSRDGPDQTSTGSSTSAEPRPSVVVQFVGNSYTAGGVGPMLTALAAQAGLAIEARVIAPGGQTLQGHWMTETTVDAITAGDVDAVSLQGQSLEPWLGSDSFLEHADLLGDAACDAGAEVVLFQTWARAAGHEAYALDPAVMVPDDLQQILSDAYAAAAATSCATVVPVGDAWQHVWTEAPEIALHAGDGSHATVEGTYLAACVFAEAMLGVNVEGSWAPDGIDTRDAVVLQTSAHCVVGGNCP